MAEARAAGLVRHIVIDGVTTAEPKPNDTDLIVIVVADYGFGADLSPSQYNVLSKMRGYENGSDLTLSQCVKTRENWMRR